MDASRHAGVKNRILASGINLDSAAGFADLSGTSLGDVGDAQHRLIYEVHQRLVRGNQENRTRAAPDKSSATIRIFDSPLCHARAAAAA